MLAGPHEIAQAPRKPPAGGDAMARRQCDAAAARRAMRAGARRRLAEETALRQIATLWLTRPYHRAVK